MNFPNVPTRERAQELAPLPRLSTDEDRRDNWRREHRLGIAEMGEEAMALWRQHFPQDIINKREFYVQRRAERDKRRAERAAYHEDKRRRKADAQFNMRLGAASPWNPTTVGIFTLTVRRRRRTSPRRSRTTRSS